MLCLYTDGGPDYHCTYTCVQLSYICLFIALDLDYFVTVWALLQNSWKNPIERIISILNLGLQSVGLMRTEMNNESERLISKCGIINEICKVAEENSTLKEDLIESLQALINLICSMFDHQSLKDKPFKTFTTASETEMERLWETIQLIDDSVTNKDHTAEHIKQRVN
jgi:hypothetical protein